MERVTAGFIMLGLAAVLLALSLSSLLPWLFSFLAVFFCGLLLFILQPRGKIPVVDTASAAEPFKEMPAFIEALPDPCIVIDFKGDIQAFNRKALLLSPKLENRTPLSFYLRMPELTNAVRNARHDKPAIVSLYEKVPLERWMTAYVTPFKAAGGSDLLCIVFHDFTALQQTERMRVDFIANASHELRTPLSSIIGFIETLQGPARDDERSRAHFLSIMLQQARRMSRLVDDLLSLSRIERHAHILPEEPVDLGSLLADTIASLQPLAKERAVLLTLDQDKGPSFIQGDRDEIIRAFENLVENAIKYGCDGKKVDVSLFERNNEWHVAVQDYGPGIAQEHLPRLTERFYRVDEASSHEKGGTGLGLAIVKHILNRHRGRLEIESRRGQGSLFTVILPQAAGADPQLS